MHGQNHVKDADSIRPPAPKDASLIPHPLHSKKAYIT